MTNTVFYQSDNGHFYYTNTDLPLTNLCNPKLLQISQNNLNPKNKKEDYDFYKKKYDPETNASTNSAIWANLRAQRYNFFLFEQRLNQKTLFHRN